MGLRKKHSVDLSKSTNVSVIRVHWRRHTLLQLTQAWRRFPAESLQHHHYSCSQSSHHSPAQKALCFSNKLHSDQNRYSKMYFMAPLCKFAWNVAVLQLPVVLSDLQLLHISWLLSILQKIKNPTKLSNYDKSKVPFTVFCKYRHSCPFWNKATFYVHVITVLTRQFYMNCPFLWLHFSDSCELPRNFDLSQYETSRCDFIHTQSLGIHLTETLIFLSVLSCFY